MASAAYEYVIGAGLVYLVLPAILAITYYFSARSKLYPDFPLAGLGASGFFGSLDKARKQWAEHGPSILQQGLKKFPGCFQVVTASGPTIVLPGRFVNEIRNDPRMDFGSALQDQFFGDYPGFEVFRADHVNEMTIEMVKGRLTQSLNYITPELTEETAAVVKQLCGEPTTWKDCQFKPMVLDVVARVSSRVFVGPELCANEDWLDLSVSFTGHAMEAVEAMAKWPPFLRPFVHRFLPEVRNAKKEFARAREVLAPVIQKRREQNRKAYEAGEARAKVADTIGWFDELAKGRPYDEVQAQLGLALAAIHTTSEMVSGVIIDLCDHPEWLNPVRQDMEAAIREHGWSKKALQNMRLVDSLMKESQRHHVPDTEAMQRMAKEDVQLSDGTRIPKGAFTMVAPDLKYDLSIFGETASEYRPQRFLELRQKPGHENKWQFVTTAPEHLAFGHGMHSCPGRFFASNEVKVILVHLLTKYDWKWAAQGRKDDSHGGIFTATNASSLAMIKIRSEEFPSSETKGK